MYTFHFTLSKKKHKKTELVINLDYSSNKKPKEVSYFYNVFVVLRRK